MLDKVFQRVHLSLIWVKTTKSGNYGTTEILFIANMPSTWRHTNVRWGKSIVAAYTAVIISQVWREVCIIIQLIHNCLSQRLAQIGLIPHDVGGSGDCFFKSVSHQLYGTADPHIEVRMAGISHLHNYSELYIESISDDTWENYLKQMSIPSTWCDHLIIQAVANCSILGQRLFM